MPADAAASCCRLYRPCRIGCADARMPANDLIGLRPGEVLVQVGAKMPACLPASAVGHACCRDSGLYHQHKTQCCDDALAMQRNVGNIASFKDMNLMSCLEYAVAGGHGALPSPAPRPWITGGIGSCKPSPPTLMRMCVPVALQCSR